MKRTIIIRSIVLLLSIVGYVSFNKPLLHDLGHAWEDHKERFAATSEVASDKVDSGTNLTGVVYMVTYTATGYSPSRLQIQLGDTIQFVNQSDNTPMWTASDPHPVHTDYNDFDARKDYLPGETYTYTFTKEGTFGWHNHSKSLHRGIVQVVDSSKPVIDIQKTRTEQGRKQRDELMKLLKPEESRGSIQALFDAIKKNPKLVKDCHDMAHDFGHEAYELYGFSRAMTFDAPDIAPINDTDDLCAGGYMHGILEEVFLHDDDLQYHPEKICISVPEANQGSCYHGVGHGLMFNHKRNVKDSIQSCNLLPEFIQQTRCYEGVYMEMFRGSTGHADGYLGRNLSDTPTKACLGIPEKEEPACYLYAHLGYLRTHFHDYHGAINLCLNTIGMSDKAKSFCIKGIGITMMKSVGSKKLENTELYVKKVPQKYKSYYYQGVLGYALLSGMKKSQLTSVCNKMKDDTEVCLTELKKR